MVIATLTTRKKKTNHFITDDEVKILWRWICKYESSKWRALFALIIGRGLRIGEAVAVNIMDFSRDFSELRVIMQKSLVDDVLPLTSWLQDEVKLYVHKNKHLFKDGYLFPYYSHKNKSGVPYMTSQTAVAVFAKIRKKIGKQYPEFLDKVRSPTSSYVVLDAVSRKIPLDHMKKTLFFSKSVSSVLDDLVSRGFLRKDGSYFSITLMGFSLLKKGSYAVRYRISFHSLRRWFETTIYENLGDRNKVANIMRYIDPSTVDTYIDPYRTWRDERDMLDDSLTSFYDDLAHHHSGQKKLTSF